MKNNLILFFVMLSGIAYSQKRSSVTIEASLIDSIIMMPNVIKVDVSSAAYKDKFTHLFCIEIFEIFFS
jgi:hypothetical protein